MAANPRPTKGEQTRRAILDAAIDRFGHNGYRSTSVADIARAAGVGGTVPYTYFADKEALFFAAIDEDAAAAINEAMSGAFEEIDLDAWRDHLFVSLIGAVEHRPLAHRLLAGLEPDVTRRVLEMPALIELRKTCVERIRSAQAEGTVRSDIDAQETGSGVVAILLSLLMSLVQLGPDTTAPYANDIVGVFRAALVPPEQASRHSM